MLVLGLTGSIGMGKTTVAAMLEELGFPVFSADAFLHDAMARGGEAVAPLAVLFPEAVRGGSVDRVLLGALVFSDPQKLKKLENALHPIVRKAEERFIAAAKKGNARAAILEIPLLFETKAEKLCDKVLCVSTPLHVQRARVLKRHHMTEEKFRAIRARQMTHAEKKKRSDIIIPTDITPEQTRSALIETLATLGLMDKAPAPTSP